MSASPLGKLLVIVGLAIAALGALLILAGRSPFLGKLPGDIMVQRKSFSFYFPVTTCIVLSVLLSLIMWLLSRR